MRVCSKCHQRKKNELFVRNRSRKCGYATWCKECNTSISRTTDPLKRRAAARRSLLKKHYGLTEEQYNDLLSKQQGCCGVCKRHHSEFKRNLAVDHDHSDFSIRGLLCDYCNRFLIGRLRKGTQGVELLRQASDYLDGPYSGLFAPGNVQKKRRKKKKKIT